MLSKRIEAVDGVLNRRRIKQPTSDSAVEKPDNKDPERQIDIHIGSRIQLRRVLLGISREHLGVALGVTSQQIQKYEQGRNRVSASHLFDISRVLGVHLRFFFDDAQEETIETSASGSRLRGSVRFEIARDFWTQNWVDLQSNMQQSIPFEFPTMGSFFIESISETADRKIYVVGKSEMKLAPG